MSATRLLWAQVAPKFGPFIPHRLPLSTIGASLPRLGNFAPLPVPFVSTRRVSPIANMKAPGIGLGNVRTLFISSQDRLSGRVGHSLAGTSFLGPLATLAKPNSSSPFLRFRSTWHNQAARRPSGSSRAAATPKQSSYKTPSLNYFDRNPSYLIYLIIGICTAVFLAWQYAQQSWQKFGDRSLANFMANNFLCSWDGVMAGRWWTLLTSTFSHNEPMHFIFNMFVLHSFGKTVIQTIGARLFAQLFLVSGVASSLVGLAYYRLFDRRTRTASHGASGSITAVTAVFASIYPTATILVMFFPMPAWLAVGGMVGYDLYRALANRSGRTNTAAHVGGAMTGFLYYWIRIRPYLRPL